MAIQKLGRTLVLISLPFLLFSNCGTSETKEALPQSDVSIGESLYLLHCASCHGSNGDLCAFGAKDLTQSKRTKSQVMEIIHNGKNAMPAFGGQLEKNKIDSLTNFVFTLRKK